MQTVAVATLMSMIVTWKALAGALAFLTAIEWIVPRGARQSLGRRLNGLLISILGVATVAVLSLAFHAAWKALGLHRIQTLDLNAMAAWAGPLAAVAAAIMAAMIADLAFYWFHRAQHACPWLWRLHAVHHSIRDMNAVNAYHHISEALLRLVFTAIPLSWLDIHAEGAAFVGALFGLQAIAIHSPTTLHAGPLRRILVDNRFHRIHHSLSPAHFDKNFAANFSFWDQLFGTAYFPGANEWPDVGLSNLAEPPSLGAWISGVPPHLGPALSR